MFRWPYPIHVFLSSQSLAALILSSVPALPGLNLKYGLECYAFPGRRSAAVEFGVACPMDLPHESMQQECSSTSTRIPQVA